MSSMTTVTVVLLLLLSIFSIGIQSSGVVKEYQDEVPGHEGECKGKDNKFYKLGEAIKDEPCVRKVCRGTAAPGSVHIDVERCENANNKSECKLKPNVENTYPNCCSKLECKN